MFFYIIGHNLPSTVESDENEEDPREFSVTKAVHNASLISSQNPCLPLNPTRNNPRKAYVGINSRPMTSVDYENNNQENINSNRRSIVRYDLQLRIAPILFIAILHKFMWKIHFALYSKFLESEWFYREVKFTTATKVQSAEPKRDFIKFDIKDCLSSMIKGTQELSQRTSKSGSRSMSKSMSRSKSIPRGTGHSLRQETPPIMITNQKISAKPILKPSGSVRSFHSGNTVYKVRGIDGKFSYSLLFGDLRFDNLYFLKQVNFE